MSAAIDKAVAERVMGWTLQGNRWIDAGGQDTSFRTATWKPSEDRVAATRVLKHLVQGGRTARIEEDATEARVFLFDEKLEGVTEAGEPINVGAEWRRATARAFPGAVCGAALG